MRFLFFVFTILFSSLTFAQNEGNIWYFGGNAGLDFNSGSPVALDDGALVTLEGCATISDANGDLLFYTDGSSVYNANHAQMPNGFGLNGNSSSSQSAIIVRKPGTTDIYTIFTVPIGGTADGLQYSDVNMSLDGGLGDVVTTLKNVFVYGPTCERITAIKHQNGEDFWIVTKEFNGSNFRSYLFDNSGLSSTWVSSDAGITTNTLDESRGYIRTNTLGNKIAMSNRVTPKGTEVYDFDNATGLITNHIHLPMDDPYSVEFSPSGQYLYAGQGISFTFGQDEFYQYDLLAGDQAAIQASQVVLGSTLTGGALQLASDQKIYVGLAFTNYLSSISFPDLPGALCLYEDSTVQLAPGTNVQLGFPTFYNDITSPAELYNLCEGESTILSSPDFTNYNWAVEDDPSTIIGTDSTLTVAPLTSTIYILFDGPDTLRFEVNVSPQLNVDLGPNICDASNSVSLNVAQPEVTYLWQDGSDSSLFVATETGVYWVEITNGVCTDRDSIFIQFEQLQIFGDDVVSCDSTVLLAASDSNVNVGHWTYLAPPGGPQNVIFSPSNNVIDPTITVPELGEYVFMYTSLCGISDTHTVVFESEPPVLNIQATQACNFDINLSASTTQTGIWTATGPLGETINIAAPDQANTTAEVSNYGEYTFTYTYAFCDASFSATVDVLSIKPQITNTQTEYICTKTIDLSATVPGHQGQWSVTGPGIVTFGSFQSLNTTASVSEYGTYTFIYSGCGDADTLEVTFMSNAPTIHAPNFVECGHEALVEVLYYQDNIGVWSYQAFNDNSVTLSEIDDHTLSVTTDAYGEVELTYTTCDTSTSVNIVFMCELDVPNVFTPNNDGINNQFFIRNLNPTYYDRSVFTVYDRWGVEVYTNGKYGLEGSWWNGKTAQNGDDLKEGVYYYVLELHNKVKNQDESYKGSVHIFR